MRVLLVSADPRVREQIALVVKSARRSTAGPGADESFELLQASDGVHGIALAWARRPDVVVADEITSRAGAFAVARDLKGADPPFGGQVIILLDRAVDAWLARWAGADAWFVKPVDPFALAEVISASGARDVSPDMPEAVTEALVKEAG
jgi:DNA-binding NarL/FixJ family response regulator